MPRLIEVKNPFAKKTSDLKDIEKGYGAYSEGYNTFKELAEAAQKYEKYSIELAKLSGKIKRACKTLHALVEEGRKGDIEHHHNKATKYYNKIYKKLNDSGSESLNSMLKEWCNKIEQTHKHYLSENIRDHIYISVLDLYK